MDPMDPYLWLMDPDLDPRGPKTYESDGSGSATLLSYFGTDLLFESHPDIQCCGSGMFIPDPGSWFLPIPDPGSQIPDPGSRIQKQQWETGEKNLFPYLIFGAINFTKLNYFIFEMLKKKILANFQRIIELFTQKIVTKHSKIWVWDRNTADIRKLYL